MAGPLNGVRVVEVANWTFVPAAGAVLADLGADVIKVEPPNGDPQRALLNMLNLKGGGPNPFIEIPNRGKRSVTCDLTTDAGHEALAAIVRSADVFVTSNLAPIRRKLRIEVEDVRAANPDIIYVRGTGWGNEGPMADVGGYDLACGWASSGMAFKMNKGGIEPLPQPPAFFDLQGANTIAGAIGFALFKRANTGETSVVDVSLMHVGMWALSPDITGRALQRRRGRLRGPQAVAQPAGQRLRHQRRPLGLLRVPSARPVLGRVLHAPGTSRPDRRRALRRLARRATRTGSSWSTELDREFIGLTLDEIRTKFDGFSGVWAPVLRPSELHSPSPGRGQRLPPARDGTRRFATIASWRPRPTSRDTRLLRLDQPPNSGSTPRRSCSSRVWTGTPSRRSVRPAGWVRHSRYRSEEASPLGTAPSRLCRDDIHQAPRQRGLGVDGLPDKPSHAVR